MLLLEAIAALLLTLASALVILAVITADRWDEPERQDGLEETAARSREAA